MSPSCLPACLQALLESPDAQAADTAGLQLAAALGFAVYGFKEWKRLPLGKQPGLAFAQLCDVRVLCAASSVHCVPCQFVFTYSRTSHGQACSTQSNFICHHKHQPAAAYHSTAPPGAGRAVGLSLAALVAGILLGAGLNAWLRVDIVPIGVSRRRSSGRQGSLVQCCWNASSHCSPSRSA